MLKRTVEHTSVTKLKQLVASRFGKDLEIRQLMDLRGQDGSEDLTLKGSDLHIPIRMEGHFLGTAVVSEAAELNRQNQEDLAQVVRLVLEPTLYNWYLERKESNLQQLSEAQFPVDNIQIFKEELPSIESLFQEDADFDEDLQKPTLISNLIHLESKNNVIVKKIALQLHEMTHRWAFVPFQDIKSQLTTVVDILNLGAMTVFIENLQTLTAQDQELVLEYIKSPRSDEEPLLITSSSLSKEELKNSDLHPELVEQIEINTFEADRAPLVYQSLKEVLELFFLSDKK